MSFIVKGIDLPKDKPIKIEIFPNGAVWNGNAWLCDIRAIQILSPHGRIIDVSQGHLVREEGRLIFVKAPTILEAEE